MNKEIRSKKTLRSSTNVKTFTRNFIKTKKHVLTQKKTPTPTN